MTLDNAPNEDAPESLPLPTTPIIPPDDSRTEQEKTNAGVAKATGIVALGNIASRVLGLVREIVIANLFGATAAVDAFNVAILVPRNIYDLLIGGHVNGAIIPVLSGIVTLKGRDELWRLVSVLLSMLTVILAILVILLELGAPFIVSIIGAGFNDYTQDLATMLLRVTSPALIFMGLFAILSGTLYALKSFTWPAFATAMFNGAIVIIALGFSPSPEYRLLWDGTEATMTTWHTIRPASGIVIVAIGWLVGSVAYTVLQLPGLRDAKLRFTLVWKHPALRKIGLLYMPVMFSLVLDTLVVRLFSYNLASKSGDGSIAYMNWATTLIQFPQGLVATAISIAILPTLSRQAALIAEESADRENSRAFKDTLGLGMRLATSLIIPATIGLFVLATPIIALIFQHGAFNATDTHVTTDVLRLYLIGLPFAAIDLLLVYAFYARQDTVTPAVIGFFSLTFYMMVALVLWERYGLFSLMIADSVKHIIHAGISAYLLNRRMGGFSDSRLLWTAIKSLIASVIMGAVAFGLLTVLEDILSVTSIIHELLLVGLCAGGSIVVFMLMAYWLKIDEWQWLVGLVRGRLGRG